MSSTLPRKGKKPVSDLIGRKFERLTVVEYVGKGKWGKHYWKCFCDCGGETTLSTSQLTSKCKVKSCGCLRRETLREYRFTGIKHGLHKHPLYSIYHGMLYRCRNPNCLRWEYYGGKGVKVCKEWSEDFLSFYNWSLENGWESGLSIDRVDSDGDYEPSNCRWVTLSENTARSNVRKR